MDAFEADTIANEQKESEADQRAIGDLVVDKKRLFYALLRNWPSCNRR